MTDRGRREMNEESAIFALSDRYIAESAALDPMLATFWGTPGYDHLLTDYSPDGWAARLDLCRRTLAEADRLVPSNPRDRIAIDVMRERLTADRDLIESGEYHRWLSVMNSFHEFIREVFDFMPRQSEEDWHNVLSRLEAVPNALEGLKASFEHAADRGMYAALRQVELAAAQCDAWGAAEGPFIELAAECEALDISAETATAANAYLDLGRWLRNDYAPRANSNDAVGPDRYHRLVRFHNGADIDLGEAYEWGWHELRSIERRIDELVERILPGATRDECIAHLNSDSRYVVHTADEFVAWNQEVIDKAIADLDGTYFDIAEPLRSCRVQAIPPAGPKMTYYTTPNEDFTRPGQTWVPVEGRTEFSLWDALTIAYHEGAPGHHLQLAQMMYQAESLTRFQRLAMIISGHGEGWALYAERLMLELGFLDEAPYELGFLVGQALRAARVVLDIGMHCELLIPDDESFHPGERWHPDLAVPFLLRQTGAKEEDLTSEVNRYLGMPGQAIAYKLGERVWLSGRDRARQRLGERFDLRDFHRAMLEMGSMGLDLLRDELDRYGSTG
jgi:uncharacterized protein (DUF885 family)